MYTGRSPAASSMCPRHTSKTETLQVAQSRGQPVDLHVALHCCLIHPTGRSVQDVDTRGHLR